MIQSDSSTRRQQVLFVQFLSSSLRWRLTRIPSANCPLCGRPWVLQHFFQCPSVMPFLNLDTTWLRFRSLSRSDDWVSIFDLFKNVLFVWVDSTNISVFSSQSIREVFVWFFLVAYVSFVQVNRLVSHFMFSHILFYSCLKIRIDETSHYQFFPTLYYYFLFYFLVFPSGPVSFSFLLSLPQFNATFLSPSQ